MSERNTEIIAFLLDQAKKLRQLAASLPPGLSEDLLDLATAIEDRANQIAAED